MKRLFLVRGLPGSGKSALAILLAWGANALSEHEVITISADDSFEYLSGAWKQMIDLVVDSPDDKGAQEAITNLQNGNLHAYAVSGEYAFVPQFLKYAHRVCQNRVQDAMLDDIKYETIIVHNTFSQAWEATPYYQHAAANGYDVFVVECQNNFGSIHGVPYDTVENMKARWSPLT